ncbi:ricin-type beta-trefoil lectin domain protein [Sorangium sp. So ce1014]|uniref:ricin-type beta-trefoil lectin domain protein n=1 Tax=Sorangium sp. So ce1014 TaxID=3133326 RepID=UPI003F6015A6
MKSIVGRRFSLLVVGASLVATGCVVEADMEAGDSSNDVDGAAAERIGDADEALEIMDGAGSAGEAGVADTGSGSAFSLVSMMHGRCLDAPHAVDGTHVFMWDCVPGNANQRWSYNATTGELRVHKDMCLNALGTSRLSPIAVKDCRSGGNLRWDIVLPGRVMLRGITDEYGRSMCIDIGYQNRDLGAPLLLQYCHRGENQEWRRSDSGIGGATFNLESQIGRCADAPGAGWAPVLQAWDCSGTNDNQRFTRTVDSELRVHGKCLDGQTLQSGDALIYDECDGGSNQKWNRDLLGRLVSIGNPAMCADVWGASSYNGAPIKLFPCHAEANQRWYYTSIANP